MRKEVSEAEIMHFTFDALIQNRPVTGTVEFSGYWQTEKYFVEI